MTELCEVTWTHPELKQRCGPARCWTPHLVSPRQAARLGWPSWGTAFQQPALHGNCWALSTRCIGTRSPKLHCSGLGQGHDFFPSRTWFLRAHLRGASGDVEGSVHVRCGCAAVWWLSLLPSGQLVCVLPTRTCPTLWYQPSAGHSYGGRPQGPCCTASEGSGLCISRGFYGPARYRMWGQPRLITGDG